MLQSALPINACVLLFQVETLCVFDINSTSLGATCGFILVLLVYIYSAARRATVVVLWYNHLGRRFERQAVFFSDYIGSVALSDVRFAFDPKYCSALKSTRTSTRNAQFQTPQTLTSLGATLLVVGFGRFGQRRSQRRCWWSISGGVTRRSERRFFTQMTNLQSFARSHEFQHLLLEGSYGVGSKQHVAHVQSAGVAKCAGLLVTQPLQQLKRRTVLVLEEVVTTKCCLPFSIYLTYAMVERPALFICGHVVGM